jgi:hypothetical protein
LATKADFYIGRGPNAEWIGSVGRDGYPEGRAAHLLRCRTEEAFRRAVSDFLKGGDDSVFPEGGWPWPWKDSRVTDFTYAFDTRTVYMSSCGHAWFDPNVCRSEEGRHDRPKATFPAMSQVEYPGELRELWN